MPLHKPDHNLAYPTAQPNIDRHLTELVMVSFFQTRISRCLIKPPNHPIHRTTCLTNNPLQLTSTDHIPQTSSQLTT